MFPKHPSIDIVVIFVNIVNMIWIILSFLTKVLQNTNNNYLHSFVSGTDNKRNPTKTSFYSQPNTVVTTERPPPSEINIKNESTNYVTCW